MGGEGGTSARGSVVAEFFATSGVLCSASNELEPAQRFMELQTKVCDGPMGAGT